MKIQSWIYSILISILIFVLMLLLGFYCIGGFDDTTPNKIEYLDGSIITFGSRPRIYTPKTGEVTNIHWRPDYFREIYTSTYGEPAKINLRTYDFRLKLQCKIDNDTMIISLYVDYRTDTNKSHGRLYFYKYHPISNYLEPIDQLNNNINDIRQIRFDNKTKLYLCAVESKNFDRYILMNRDYDSLSAFDKSSLQLLGRERGRMSLSYIDFAYNGIVYSDGWESAYISFEDLNQNNVTQHIPGMIWDVSHGGTMLVYEKRNSDNIYVYDFYRDEYRELNVDAEIADVCFSPDDRYLAYSHITGNLMNDVTVSVYELDTGKSTNTGYIIFDWLVAWIN